MKFFDDEKYTEGEHRRIEEAIETVRDDWIDEVFDIDSKLEADEWRKRVCKSQNSWMFDADQLRTKIFESADLDKRF